MNSNKISLLAAALVIVLAGCGGGGSSAPSPTTPAPVAPPAPALPTPAPQAQWKPVVTSVPAASYSGDNLLAFNRLNSLRAAAGVGLLAQNSLLDKSSENHNSYLFSNPNFFLNGISMHAEIVGNVGFTGATVQARTAAAGYAGTVSESVSGSTGLISSNTIGAVGWGDFDVHILVNNSVYHRLDLLSNWTDVGIFVATDKAAPPKTFTVLNMGNPAGLSFGQLPAAPIVYPFANQKGADTTFVPASEVPNPAPDLGGTIGLPITVALDSLSILGAAPQNLTANEISISAFNLSVDGSSTPVPSRIIAAAGLAAAAGVQLKNDPAALMKPSQICLLPLAPLAINTKYNAVFAATVRGKPVNIAWAFTTGTNK